MLGYREVFSPDIGYHMETGRRVVEDGVFPLHEEFTFTSEGKPIQYMPWLFDAVVWLIYKHSGTLGLTLFTIAMTLGSAGLIGWRILRRTPPAGWAAVALLSLFFLGNFWEVRPHLGSWVLLNLTLLVLERYKAGDRLWLWALPAIQLVWVNSHSLFVLGLVCIGAYGIDELRKGRAGDRRFYVAAVLAGLACLISPFGLRGALYPLVQFGMLQPSSVVNSTAIGTAEFMSPFWREAYITNGRLVLYQAHLFIQSFAALAAVGILVGWRRHKLVDWLLLVGFAYVFNQAVKNFGYFLIVSAPAVACGWHTIGEWAMQRVRRRVALSWSLAAATLTGCALMAAQILTGYLYAQERSLHRFGHGFNRNHLPVGVSDFIRANFPADTRMLNSFGAGGFLHFASGSKVFIDGRIEIFGEDFYRDYIAANDLKLLPGVLTKWRIDAVVVPYNVKPQWFYHCQSAKEWRLVYADAADALFLREGFAPEVATLPPPQPGVDYPVIPRDEVSAILHRAAAQRSPGIISSAIRRHHEPRVELALTGLYLMRDQPSAAIGVGLTALRDSTFPAPEIVLNLGHAFFATGEMAHAVFCYEAFLRTDRDEFAERRLLSAQRKLRSQPRPPAAP